MFAEKGPRSSRRRWCLRETCAPQCAIPRVADRTCRSWLFRRALTGRALARLRGGCCAFLLEVERLERQQDDHFLQALEVCRRPDANLFEGISRLDLGHRTDG